MIKSSLEVSSKTSSAMHYVLSDLTEILVSMIGNNKDKFDELLSRDNIKFSYFGSHLLYYALALEDPYFMEALIDKGAIYDKYNTLKYVLLRSNTKIASSLIKEMLLNDDRLLIEVIKKADIEMIIRLAQLGVQIKDSNIDIELRDVDSVRNFFILGGDIKKTYKINFNNNDIKSCKTSDESSSHSSLYKLNLKLSFISFLAIFICSKLHHILMSSRRYYDSREASYSSHIASMERLIKSYNDYESVISSNKVIQPKKILDSGVELIKSYKILARAFYSNSFPGIKNVLEKNIISVDVLKININKISASQQMDKYVLVLKGFINDILPEKNIEFIKNGIMDGSTDILEKMLLVSDDCSMDHLFKLKQEYGDEFWSFYCNIDYFLFILTKSIYSTGLLLSSTLAGISIVEYLFVSYVQPFFSTVNEKPDDMFCLELSGENTILAMEG
jgi:hypothetical protein